MVTDKTENLGDEANSSCDQNYEKDLDCEHRVPYLVRCRTQY